MAVDHVSPVGCAQGEIVGIYGLMGAGRTEFLECIMAQHPPCRRARLRRRRAAGGRDVAGRIAPRHRADPRGPQARRADPDHVDPREHDAVLACGDFTRLFHLDLRAEARAALRLRQAARRSRSPVRENPVSSLSGGNQQKVVIGKALMTRPEGPADGRTVSRGIDIGAKAEVFRTMRQLAGRGPRHPLRHLRPRGGDVAVGPHPRDVERPHHRRVSTRRGGRGRASSLHRRAARHRSHRRTPHDRRHRIRRARRRRSAPRCCCSCGCAPSSR